MHASHHPTTGRRCVALPTGTIDLQHALVTAPPDVSQDDLQRRQSPDLRRCGYINGNSGKEQTHHDGRNIWHLTSKASEIRCASEYSCAFGNPGFALVFGCCNEVSCSKGVAATCVDAYNNICDSMGPLGCSALGTMLSCPTACVTYVMRPTEMFEYSSYVSWSCGPSPTTIIVLRSTTNELPPDNIDGANTAAGGITDTARQTTDFDPTTTGISVITNGPSASNSRNTSNGVLSPGISVAIAIGAALVLIVGVATLVYCVKKNKKKRAEVAANAARQQQFNARNPGGESEAFMMVQGAYNYALLQNQRYGTPFYKMDIFRAAQIVKGEIDDAEALSFAVAKSSMILSLLGPNAASLTTLPDPSIYSGFYARLFPLMRQHGVKRIMAMSTPSAGQPEDRFHVLMALMVLLVRFIAPKAYQAMRGIANVFKEQAQGLDWIVYRITGIPGASDEEGWKKGRESGGVHAGYVGDGTWGLTTNRSALARWLVDAVEDEEGMRSWIGKLPAVSGVSVSKAKIT
ncbi:hypothetical protein DL767_003420 [Monosporascus sp. MG133]|nr:hypothetical protein DL767_003420 [Monosporascus sp. MG133]